MKLLQAKGTKTLIISECDRPTSEDIEEFVGGSIGEYELDPETMIMFNEAGIDDNLPINAYASKLDHIDFRGDVMIIKRCDHN